MAEPGWNAAGLLRPLWAGYPGKRDGLAAAVGTTGGVLSSVNSGKRNLGTSLAERLAVELGVTVFDLGAPAAAARAREELRVVDRLRAVEAALEALGPALDALGGRVVALERRDRSRTREERRRQGH